MKLARDEDGHASRAHRFTSFAPVVSSSRTQLWSDAENPIYLGVQRPVAIAGDVDDVLEELAPA